MKRFFITALVFGTMITGCASKENQIIDLAGIIFLVFVVIVIAQLFTDKILSSKIYKTCDWVFAPIRRIVPPVAYILGTLVFVFGLLSSGLSKILLFIGFVVYLFGWFMKQYNLNCDDTKIRARYAKLMMLCLTFGFSLFFLMTAALDILKI